VILPVRAAPGFDCTENDTGLSPACGIVVVICIHGTSDSAVHLHLSCVALPHVMGSLVWTTVNWLVPPTPGMLRADVLTA
jgi:hypothetical protein